MDPALGLSLGRIAIGVSSIASPQLTAKVFGVSPEANPHMGYFTRMFGVREIALGALTLMAKGEVRRTMLKAGIAVDSGDAITGAIGLARQDVPKFAGATLTIVALGAAGSGAAALIASER
ncbi:DUF4267 domain-containing protein [Nocardioides humilatus]|uniref:DUF4267 domain-containing protein n=1 Tax=Nocardioides humilatus TaxID=2607660 RepID=A0A5B1L5N4_9ACTN|nr:DUF4267 domain-containing protein [Nocardioides humilatus]KAA1415824.1 DUF4267 domain-containing protein [Nocardioides humilatus]